MKLLDEKACIDLVDAGSDEPYDENEPKSYTFIARLNSRNKWEIELSIAKCKNRKLHARRGEVREFSRLNAYSGPKLPPIPFQSCHLFR